MWIVAWKSDNYSWVTFTREAKWEQFETRKEADDFIVEHTRKSLDGEVIHVAEVKASFRLRVENKEPERTIEETTGRLPHVEGT